MNILFYKTDKTLKIVDDNRILDDIYYQKAHVPTNQDIIKYINKNKKTDRIVLFFSNCKKKDYTACIQKIKVHISKIGHKIPLYDEYSKNLYLISRDQLYNRVVYQYYRFPDNDLYQYFVTKEKNMKKKVEHIKEKPEWKKHLGEFESSSKVHYKIAQSNVMILREYNKLNLMIKFLQSFDLNVLYKTYVWAFYNFSNEIGKNITICIRPSFLPHFRHIKPYYTRSELINLALNMEIIKPSKKYYTSEMVMKLCEKIKQNDISSKTIMNHQTYIIKNNKIGIIQYYSLQGSYFMNQYLRQLNDYEYKNPLLEHNIKSMWKLISSAPAFDKNYILYRFIKSDEHLNHLNIGDKYVSQSFISTTRDPFYRSDLYKFGFILIKIKIPKNVIGVAICMETVSHFPEEQEIILPPRSILQLDKKDIHAPYFHTDDIYQSEINTRYEFTYVGKEEISFINRPLYDEKNEPINFLNIEKEESITINEKIGYFIANYVNPYYQYKTKIGDKNYDIFVEWYDSTDVYKNFYAAKTNNGFSMYTILDNYVSFVIELGMDDEGPYMYVNYYFRYSTINKTKPFSDQDFIDYIASVAHYFEIKNVIIYADYSSCDLREDIPDFDEKHKIYHGGNYCVDFYNYLKYSKKRYSTFDSTELRTKYSFYELNRLKDTDPKIVLSDRDRDEIYTIYTKTYKNYVPKEKDNLADFYIWMIENQCVFLDDLVKKMNRLYAHNNPFENDYYVLDAVNYLYNKNLINEYPTFIENRTKPEHTPTKNMYRLPHDKMRVPKSRTDLEIK